MFRPSLSPRRLAGLGLAVAVGTGIGFGAYSMGSAGANPSRPSSTVTAVTERAAPDVTPPTTEPSPAGESASAASPAEESASAALTLDEATAVAAKVAPGRVVEWDEDHEPTGLRYDVTLLHDDGTTTDVEVDTVTGQVTSVDHDNDRD